jgi:predicted nucleic acid-binding protein
MRGNLPTDCEPRLPFLALIQTERRLTQRFNRFLDRFTPLLPDYETARLWARIKKSCEKKGRPITFAGAAVQLNLPLVRHNAATMLPLMA